MADLLLEQVKHKRVLLFRALPRELTSDVFTYLEGDAQNVLLADLTDEETRGLLSEVDPDDRTELLSELPCGATQKLLNLLSEEDLRDWTEAGEVGPERRAVRRLARTAKDKLPRLRPVDLPQPPLLTSEPPRF